MIFIKFVLTKGEITVDEEQAKNILRSEQQLIPIKDLDGNWTYETINKAYIIRTHKDYEKMRWYNVEQEKIKQDKLAQEEHKKLLAMPPEERQRLEDEKKAQQKRIAEMFANLGKSFRIGNK